VTSNNVLQFPTRGDRNDYWEEISEDLDISLVSVLEELDSVLALIKDFREDRFSDPYLLDKLVVEIAHGVAENKTADEIKSSLQTPEGKVLKQNLSECLISNFNDRNDSYYSLLQRDVRRLYRKVVDLKDCKDMSIEDQEMESK
jgi:hypothetical protein